MITPRGNRKKSTSSRKELYVTEKHYAHEYEPSGIINVRDSSPWQWRRVNEWDHYLNDPVEKSNGHIVIG